MEDVIKTFLSVDTGYGSGYGSGSGSGYGDGDGYGYGDGSGDGDGYGDGSGDGYGYGSGDGDGLKTYNGQTVYQIDGVATLIDRVSHGVAKGHILNNDLTITPCFVVKSGNTFAHGETLRAAREALMDKLFEDMPEEERIAEFVKAHDADKEYPDSDFFDWHHRLTGSCEMGRKAFAKEHGLEDLNGSRTVRGFIELCENAYGGSVIKKLKEFYPEEK